MNRQNVLAPAFLHEEVSATGTGDQLTGRRDSREQLGTELADDPAEATAKPAQLGKGQARSQVVSRGIVSKPRAHVKVSGGAG